MHDVVLRLMSYLLAGGNFEKTFKQDLNPPSNLGQQICKFCVLESFSSKG